MLLEAVMILRRSERILTVPSHLGSGGRLEIRNKRSVLREVSVSGREDLETYL